MCRSERKRKEKRPITKQEKVLVYEVTCRNNEEWNFITVKCFEGGPSMDTELLIVRDL